jgi:hypothetical protein
MKRARDGTTKETFKREVSVSSLSIPPFVLVKQGKLIHRFVNHGPPGGPDIVLSARSSVSLPDPVVLQQFSTNDNLLAAGTRDPASGAVVNVRRRLDGQQSIPDENSAIPPPKEYLTLQDVLFDDRVWAEYPRESERELLDCTEEAVRCDALTPAEFKKACQRRWDVLAPRWDDNAVWECDSQFFDRRSAAEMHLRLLATRGVGFFHSCNVRPRSPAYRAVPRYRPSHDEHTTQLCQLANDYLRSLGTWKREPAAETTGYDVLWQKMDDLVDQGADPTCLPWHANPAEGSEVKSEEKFLFKTQYEQAIAAPCITKWIRDGSIVPDTRVWHAALWCGCADDLWVPLLPEWYRQGLIEQFFATVYARRKFALLAESRMQMFRQLKQFLAPGLFWCSSPTIAEELQIPVAQADAWAVDLMNDVHALLVQHLLPSIVETVVMDYLILNGPPLFPVSNASTEQSDANPDKTTP